MFGFTKSCLRKVNFHNVTDLATSYESSCGGDITTVERRCQTPYPIPFQVNNFTYLIKMYQKHVFKDEYNNY